MICFDIFCRVTQCEHYVEWEHTETMEDHGHPYQSTIQCCSCTLVGESYNVDEYNEFCIHLKDIKVFEAKMIEVHRKFELEQEQQKAWRILNDIT